MRNPFSLNQTIIKFINHKCVYLITHACDLIGLLIIMEKVKLN